MIFPPIILVVRCLWEGSVMILAHLAKGGATPLHPRTGQRHVPSSARRCHDPHQVKGGVMLPYLVKGDVMFPYPVNCGVVLPYSVKCDVIIPLKVVLYSLTW